MKCTSIYQEGMNKTTETVATAYLQAEIICGNSRIRSRVLTTLSLCSVTLL